MLQVLEAPWPCLSFDIVPDDLGPQRKSYPAILYAVAGTQAASNKQRDNQILVMKLSGLSKTEAKRESEGSDDDDDDDNSDVETEPILESKSIPMTACTNRIRARQFGSATDAAPPTTITAAMAESGDVLLHDITPYLSSLDRPGKTPSPGNKRPMHTIQAHKSTEGYAVAWSPLQDEGKLLTGDVNGRIFVTTGSADATWATDQSPLVGHDSSVEELEWSPNERTVFASASSDGTVKIWDLRSKSRKAAVSVKISDVDVNVLSWSKQTPHLLAAGADDGKWSVWDLRQWKSAGVGANAEKLGAVASFNFHKAQVTSIEWHPTDDSVVLVAAGDHTVTLWDLAVELDTEEASGELGLPNVPSQLLFLHYMDEVKEAHWHPQIPGCVMATGGSGFK